jgi:hypothetical protein
MKNDFRIDDVFCRRVATLCGSRHRIDRGGSRMPKDAQ